MLRLCILGLWTGLHGDHSMLLNRRLSGRLGCLGVAHRLPLDRLSHRDAGLWVLLPLLTCLLVVLALLTVLLPLLILLPGLQVVLVAGACGVAVYRALLLFKALVHEAGDEAEGGQEDAQQNDSNHARAGHPLALAAPHLHVVLMQIRQAVLPGLSLLLCSHREDAVQLVREVMCHLQAVM